MKTATYHIEFLTPCFCAGANQDHAELRPSAIRGGLRWWFRALGGSASEEGRVFGAVHGDVATASRVVIRARTDGGTGEVDWFKMIQPQGMDRSAYLLGFFCGRTARLKAGGALAPGSTATVWVTFRTQPTMLLELATKVFFSFGGIGFRATRAGGSFHTHEHALTDHDWSELKSALHAAGFVTALLPDRFGSWNHLVDHAGNLLKDRLRSKSEGLGISAGKNGKTANALGSAEPRQASSVHFRAVRIDGVLRLALLEAPHQKVLGKPALHAHNNRGSIIRLAGLAD